jgi:electron transfer flavoprotein beta subunit
LRVVVCTKETPDTAAKLEINPDGTVTWGDAPLVINPWDEYAVEEALLLKEHRGATLCTVLGVGTEATKEALRSALAMGCDEAVLITDPVFKGADTLVTSYALAQGIRKLDDVGLVIFGRITTDGGTGQTPVQVGRRLGWNTLTFVSKIVELDFAAGTITVERMLEGGKQICQSRLPAVISVMKGINEPRFPSFMALRKAQKMPISEWDAAALSLDPAITAKVKWPEVFAPPPRQGECEMIEGATADEIAAKLVDRLMAEKVV